MLTALLSDFSRVLLRPKNMAYAAGLNALHKKLTGESNGTYQIFDYFEFNEELLDFYKSLKGKYPISLFTTDIIQNHPEIRARLEPIFDHIFAANDLGLSKKDSQAYIFIANKLHLDPHEIVYIDDQPGNVEAANEAGLTAFQYNNNNQETIARIKALLPL
ncbi:MAG: HAD-IA family hydrolase [bacterium]|nr:HAD-IA family hydrolase [bacterium]